MTTLLREMSTLLRKVTSPLSKGLQAGAAPPLAPNEREVIKLLQANADNIFDLGVEDRLTTRICIYAIAELGILGIKGDSHEYLAAINCCWTSELCWLALKTTWRSLEYIPPALHTNEMYIFAINQCAEALRFVPAEKRTSELCAIAVAKSGVEPMDIDD
jgi:hypothetical protein